MAEQSPQEFLDEQQQYAMALGFFVMKFAETERTMHIALAMLSGLGVYQARAVFSGVRVAIAKGHINRLMDVNGVPEGHEHRNHIRRCFEQLTLISNVRNDLLHYGISNDDTLGPVATNEFGLHLPEKARKAPVTPAILLRMAQDLNQINWTVSTSCAILCDHAGGDPMLEQFAKVGRGPWRYTPPSPPPPPNQIQRSRGRPKSPPPASQA